MITVWLCNFLSKEYQHKSCSKNVGEIHNWCQHLIHFGDPESPKNTDGLTVFFALLGSACVKAAHKMFVKFTTRVNFTNILREVFMNADRKNAKKD